MTGNVINLIDQRVWNLTPHFVSYTLSKAGLWTLTRTMALALAPRIRVNAIGPGPTLPSPRQTEEQFARQKAATPLGRAPPPPPPPAPPAPPGAPGPPRPPDPAGRSTKRPPAAPPPNPPPPPN